MTDFHVRSDSVDVEQIMRQIRARIREKRGADYTEAELQQLAQVKLETFLDPRGLRSDLIEQFRRRETSEPIPNYAFEDTTLYETHRGAVRFLRRLLHPFLKLLFNPNRITDALHIQSQVNAEVQRRDALFYELIHNLVLEVTRLGIEVHNLKMRVESMSSRLDFDERRARSLEGVVEYRSGDRSGGQARPAAGPGPSGADQAGGSPRPEGRGREIGPGGGERRRRRRRRRRRPGQTLAETSPAGGPAAGSGEPEPPAGTPAADDGDGAADQ
jgi:hypothetical protein